MEEIEEIKGATTTKSRASMLLAAFFMGNAGLLVSFLAAFPSHTIVLLRGIFGSLFLFLFALKTNSISKRFLSNILKNHWKPILVICSTYSLGMLVFFTNMIVSGYAVSVFFSYTNGIFLLILLILFKEEKVSKINIFSFALVIFGIAIITEFWNGLYNSIGILLGMITGLCIAIDVFFKKKIYKKQDLIPTDGNHKGNLYVSLALFQHLFSVIVFFPLGFLDLPKLTGWDIFYSMLLGLGPSALGFFLFNYAIKNDKGGNVFILSYFEPVVATVNAALFLQEFSIFTIIGGSFIIMGSFIMTRYSKQEGVDLELAP